jgi:hypothetical protein
MVEKRVVEKAGWTDSRMVVKLVQQKVGLKVKVMDELSVGE